MSLSNLIPSLNFFSNYAEAILIATEDSQPLLINHAFTRLTGYEQQDLATLNPSELYKVRVNFSQTSESPVSYWETSFDKKDGTLIWLKVSLSQIELADKKIGKIYTLIDNPTIDQLKGLLKESETRFSSLADASPVMIWMTDPDNLCYYFNKSWLDFTGKKFEEELGTGWLRGVHPEDMKAFSDLGDKLNRKEDYSFEYRLMRNDNVYRNILEIGTGRFLPDGNFAGYMGSCLDITEMKQTRDELADQTKELLRSNEELEQFAYVASHDLQEPLRMIISYVQLISRNIQQGNTAGLEEFMKYVLDGTGRMQAMINDLLQFSRVSLKGNPFNEVDLNEVLKISITHLTTRIKENNALVTFMPMPKVMGDTFQLIRLFQNLIDNAIKFKAQDRQPEIKISVEEQSDSYVFAISDNGIGIEDKFYNRIFVIFQRLHTRNEYEGTGIGLSVCKKIVERHGGEIWLESKQNIGTTFFFSVKK